MQITVHEFTLTGQRTAAIKVTADTHGIHHLPNAVIMELAQAEALELTGFEWEAAVPAAAPDLPGETYTLNLSKI